MTVAVPSRISRITIGGLDCSAAFAGCQLSGQSWDGSGLNLVQGSLTLAATAAFTESLDPRDNNRWRIGNTVVFETQDASGVFALHPRGALRILSAKPEGNGLNLGVGCLLQLLSTEQPTDPDDLGITYGTLTSRNAIIASLLGKLGIPHDLPVLPNPIDYPINPGSNPVQTIGGLLYAVGAVGWMDNQEVFRARFPDLRASSAAYTCLLGRDELYHFDLSDPETPRDIVRAVGVGRKKTALGNRTGQYVDTLVDANEVDPAISPGAGLTVGQRTQVLESFTIEGGNFYHRITTNLWLPRGIALDLTPRLALELTETKVVEKNYGPANDRSGRLIRSIESITQAKGVAFPEYYEANPSNPFAPYLSERITTDYQYDSAGRLSKITTTTLQPEAKALEGIGEDWANRPNAPTNGITTAKSVQEWRLVRPQYWDFEDTQQQILAQAKPDLIEESTSLSQKTALVFSKKETLLSQHETQLNPPAVDYRPADSWQDEQLEAEARLVQYSANPYQRQRSPFQVDFLQGYSDEAGRAQAVAQLRAIAAQEAALLHGRYQGKEIGLPLANDLLTGWQPLQAIDVTEADGAVRRYLLDNDQWEISSSRCQCSFDGIWVGRILSAALIPPYIDSTSLAGGLVLGGQIQIYYQFPLPPDISLIGGLLAGGQIEVAPDPSTLIGGMRLGGSQTFFEGGSDLFGGLRCGGTPGLRIDLNYLGGLLAGGQISVANSSASPLQVLLGGSILLFGGLVVGGQIRFLEVFRVNAVGGLRVGGQISVSNSPSPSPVRLLLLHCDGSSNSQVFADDSGQNQSVASSGAIIDTSQSFFGGSSAYFNGSGGLISSSPLYAVGQDDFTLELFFRSQDVSASSQRGILQLSNRANGLSTDFTGGIAIIQGVSGDSASDGGLAVFAGGNSMISIGGVAANTWHYFGLSRRLGVFSIWLNGVQLASATIAVNVNAVNLLIGGAFNIQGFFLGHIDEIFFNRHLVKNFSPVPSSPFV